MNPIYMGSRKRQDILSKLGTWGPREKLKGRGERRGAEKNVQFNKINKKTKKNKEAELGKIK